MGICIEQIKATYYARDDLHGTNKSDRSLTSIGPRIPTYPPTYLEVPIKHIYQ